MGRRNFFIFQGLFDEFVGSGHRLGVEGFVELLAGHQALLEYEVVDAAAALESTKREEPA